MKEREIMSRGYLDAKKRDKTVKEQLKSEGLF